MAFPLVSLAAKGTSRRGSDVRRDLGELDNQSFDVLVIGGGLVGASIARDAARRGLSAALVERDDFASGASEGMPRLVIGAIGHHLPRRLVPLRRLHAEAAAWRRTAPNFVSRQPCMVPVTSRNPARNAVARLALEFYARAGRTALPDMDWPVARLPASDALSLEPAVWQDGLRGAMVYPDWRIDEPERLVLALVNDAVAQGAVVANHVECDELVLLNGKLAGARLYDRIAGNWLEVFASTVVNATGAWSASTVARLLGASRVAAARLWREIRIVTPAIAATHALAFPEEDGDDLTIVPWRGMSVVGTALEAFEREPDDTAAEADDVAWLAERAGRLVPAARDALSSPVDGFATLRILPRTPERRRHLPHGGSLVDHAGDGMAGLLSVGGGEWTTIRPLAERVVDRIVAITARTARPCDTAVAPLSETVDADPGVFAVEWSRAYPYWPDGEIAAWASAYGAALPDVIARAGEAYRPSDAVREVARFAYARDEEMAVLPDDFARRLSRWYELSRPGVAIRAAEWLAGRAGPADPA